MTRTNSGCLAAAESIVSFMRRRGGIPEDGAERSAWLAMKEAAGWLTPAQRVEFVTFLLLSVLEDGELAETEDADARLAVDYAYGVLTAAGW